MVTTWKTGGPPAAAYAKAQIPMIMGLIGDHQWQAATPDEHWSVRDLVNHVAGGRVQGAGIAGIQAFR